MTRLNNLYHGVNLAQGFPDCDPPGELLDAAAKALREGYNQYASTGGAPRLRQAVAEKFGWYNGVNVDPDLHITVTCFFFSSRRRHTRFDCDWSSDVCSSD